MESLNSKKTGKTSVVVLRGAPGWPKMVKYGENSEYPKRTKNARSIYQPKISNGPSHIDTVTNSTHGLKSDVHNHEIIEVRSSADVKEFTAPESSKSEEYRRLKAELSSSTGQSDSLNSRNLFKSQSSTKTMLRQCPNCQILFRTSHTCES
jgi:hypothetical protein